MAGATAATRPPARPTARRRRWRGVTLLELMIVVAVVALLASIAVPSYRDSVRKARRTEARTALTTCAQRLERHYTENNAYTGATVALCASDVTPSYDLQLTVSGANAYALVAVPRAAQTGDDCGRFTLDQDGVRGVAGGSLSAADCW